MRRPSSITVERLIRHFSANEYEDSCRQKDRQRRGVGGREDVQLPVANLFTLMEAGNRDAH